MPTPTIKLFLCPKDYKPNFYDGIKDDWDEDDWDVVFEEKKTHNKAFICLSYESSVNEYGTALKNLAVRSKATKFNSYKPQAPFETNSVMHIDVEGIERAVIPCTGVEPFGKGDIKSDELRQFIYKLVYVDLDKFKIYAPYLPMIGKPEFIKDDIAWDLFANHLNIPGVEYINETKFRIDGIEYTDETLKECPRYTELFIRILYHVYADDYIFIKTTKNDHDKLPMFGDFEDYKWEPEHMVTVICI